MRVSVKEWDIGYRDDATFYKAFLNGEELCNCFTADEERGEVFVHATDGYGEKNYILNPDGKSIKETRLTGKVKLQKIEEG